MTAEYGVSKASISKWCKEFSEECQQNTSKNLTAQNDLELMKENRRLREELADARKENEEIYLHEYRDEESLYRAVEHFAYTIYNHVRPHSYNGYRTPFEARYST